MQGVMYHLGRKHVFCEVVGCMPKVSVADVPLLFAFGNVVFPPRLPPLPPEGGRAAAYQRDVLPNSRGALVNETWAR